MFDINTTPFTQGYSERARQVLELTKQETQRLNQEVIGTQYLLLGILREENSLAASVLIGFGLPLGLALSAVEYIMGRGEHPGTPISVTGRYVTVLRNAHDEATRFGAPMVDPEHLLLAITGLDDGIAIGVMETSGVFSARVRERLELLLTPPSQQGV